MIGLTTLQVYTFKDIFKKSFLNGVSMQEMSLQSAIFTMLVSVIIALYIFIIYRLVSRKTFYSKTFNISLVGVAVITSSIIITIQSSIVISLGMVGALSIVRFRTAIKNPLDLMFLFWSISVGIICGAGYSIYAVFLSLIITLSVFFLDWLPIAKAPSILVVNASSTCSDEAIFNTISQFCKHYTIKAHSINSSNQSLTIEISNCNNKSAMLKELNAFENIQSASILMHDGEVTF